jgi:hypothetical protein
MKGIFHVNRCMSVKATTETTAILELINSLSPITITCDFKIANNHFLELMYIC